jgi:hypothetical protein
MVSTVMAWVQKQSWTETNVRPALEKHTEEERDMRYRARRGGRKSWWKLDTVT